eukprot:CAMPEP_0114257516 /NCGR_PEP_ID=MMETSP0058-20121206/18779_1 /TAXON_ID=36894 /ORGANISM="Pyramimonas parkeae, CCMP726" /LENGTH=306 /DNA_ID=CAMNT_0001372257 /DNA_START=59 /DNA_END=980 /DNA_ORIENTATION=+
MVLGVQLVGGFLGEAANKIKNRIPGNIGKPGEKIDGTACAAQITAEIKAEIEAMVAKTGKAPGLAVVIVGARKDSQTYVNMKKKKCQELGIQSFGSELPDTASQDEVLKLVRQYNADPNVHGILVQLPLPKHIDEEIVLREISVEKDVDGFHPLNIGALSMKGRDPGGGDQGQARSCGWAQQHRGHASCDAAAEAGRDRNNCAFSKENPKDIVKQADIIIACAGQAQMVKKDWVKPGATVIDVGTNPVPDATKKSGVRLVGDVDYEGVIQVAGGCTPVPGGVGPMTIAMLMRNTCDSGARALMGAK